MKAYLLIILIGLVAGFIGIIPLLRRKVDKYILLGAFVFFFLMPYTVYHIHIAGVNWWLKGPLVTFVLVLPLAIAAGKSYRRCIFPLLLMAVVVGAFVSFLGHYLL